MLKSPILAVNFKLYKNATASNAVKLAKILADLGKKLRVQIVVCAQASDVYRISKAVKIPIFAQHVDAVDYGAHTGHILSHDVKENGAVGTLLNHAEDQYADQTLSDAIKMCKQAKLLTMVCANTAEKARVVAHLKPDYIAYEPPELIGGDISVTTQPHVIEQIVRDIRSIDTKIKIVVGAGVHTPDDIRTALRLRADGVLLASAIAASEDPGAIASSLLKAFSKR